VAIKTKYGILQVKKSSNSNSNSYDVDVKRQNFDTYEAWVATLPTGGAITKTLPQDMLSELEIRKKHSAEALAEGGTATAIYKLQKIWNVRTSIIRAQSLNERISSTEDGIGRLRGELNRLTIEQDMNTPSLRRRTTRSLEKLVFTLTQLKARVVRGTPEQNAYHNRYISDNHKQRLYVNTSKGKLQIACDLETDSVAVVVPTGTHYWMTKLEFVKHLEDLPFIGPTKLSLSVAWRCRDIDLSA
jgi:hypothetical protein